VRKNSNILVWSKIKIYEFAKDEVDLDRLIQENMSRRYAYFEGEALLRKEREECSKS